MNNITRGWFFECVQTFLSALITLQRWVIWNQIKPSLLFRPPVTWMLILLYVLLVHYSSFNYMPNLIYGEYLIILITLVIKSWSMDTYLSAYFTTEHSLLYMFTFRWIFSKSSYIIFFLYNVSCPSWSSCQHKRNWMQTPRDHALRNLKLSTSVLKQKILSCDVTKCYWWIMLLTFKIRLVFS